MIFQLAQEKLKQHRETFRGTALVRQFVSD